MLCEGNSGAIQTSVSKCLFYDDFGRTFAETNQLGQMRTSTYSDRGQLVAVIHVAMIKSRDATFTEIHAFHAHEN